VQALHWVNYRTSKTQKSAAGRHSPKDKGTQKKQTKNFFGDALGCIHARELIRSAVERAIDRSSAGSVREEMGAGGGRDGGGRPRVDKVPRDKTGHLSGDVGFDWRCVCWGRDQVFYWPCLPRQV
jgi:hypothetical protein